MSRYCYAFIVLLFCAIPGLSFAQPYGAAAASTQAANTTYIKGITNTLLTYPSRAEQILGYYAEIDTTKIDFTKFHELIARGNYNEIYNEVDYLYSNRQAFNNGALTDVSYYKVEVPPQPAPALQTSMAAKRFSMANLKFYAGAGLVTAGAVAAVGSGGGGGSGSSRYTVDAYGRQDIAYLTDPADFIDTEYSAYPLNALSRINAQYAYAKGLTGAGVKIGFYDSFSDGHTSPSDSMNSRIIYRNLNTVQDCIDYPGQCDHGETVMTFAADDRNGTDSFGVAYEASLLMTSFNADTARDLADNGADIINLSCGNCATIADLNYITNQDIFVSISTGNEGLSNPSLPASYASMYDYSVIAVTGVFDIAGVPSVFIYNECGLQKDFCMAAYSDSGTSFSAPQISGAAALLKQGWSFLTAKQIGQILLASAKDIGAAGVDEVFGHGLLDIKTAVEPIGPLTTVNGNGIVQGFNPSGIQQNQITPFGDAFANAGNAAGNAVVLDSFGRDFEVKAADNLNVAKKITMSADTMKDIGSKNNEFKTMQFGDRVSFGYSQQKNIEGNDDMASFAEYNVNPTTKVKLAFSTSMDSIVDNKIQKFNKSNFISSDLFDVGFLKFSDNNQVFYQSFELDSGKKMTTRVSSFYSKDNFIEQFENVQNQVTSNYTSNMIETIYATSPTLDFNVKNGLTHEFDSLLGTKFTGAFDMANGADTYFSGMDVSYDIHPKLNIFASYTMGVTKATPAATSAFSNVSDLTSDSFSITATRSEILGQDKLSFSVGQPTRVRSGTAQGMRQSVNHATGETTVTGFEQSLVPTGRTMLMQAAYERALSDDIDMNFAFAYANQPNHQREKDADKSALVKMVYRFN